MKIKRVPSFMSSRPGFPAGLRVLLLEKSGCKEACAQLKQCSYSVTCCNSVEQALETMRGSSTPFDIMLADAALLTSNCTGSKQLKEAVKKLPTLLMSENPKPDEVMLSIGMGVAEVLEKPLCPLKLKNIWQHTIRRVMLGKSCRKSPDALRDMSSHSATHPQLDLSPSASRDLNNTATSCDDALLMLQCSSPTASASQQAVAAAKDDMPDSDSRRGQKRKSIELSGSNTVTNTAQTCSQAHTAEAARLPTAPQQAGPALVSTIAAADASLTGCAMGTGAASWPGPVAGRGLAPGMVWGTPMNPQHVAPGITPPIFPAPLAPPPVPPMLPCSSWPALGMPPMTAGPMLPPCGLPAMPGMPPMGMPGANPFMPGMMPPLAGQVPPLPMPMLMSACSPTAVMPGVMDALSPCSPCQTSATSMSDKSCQDALRIVDGAAALKTKIPRCESHQLLPSLEDLMADNGPAADMELELEALSFAFKRNNSLDDLISQAVPAF